MKYTFKLLAVFCTLAAFRSNAQLPAAYTARLQTVLDSMCEVYHIKGASAAVLVPGAGTWKGVHGESYSGQPITPDMAFPLNSNTKTYVATLMLKLQESGALSLDDTIGTWIQNIPYVNGQVTIRQMLNHTSGLASYTDNPAFADSVEADLGRIWQPQELLQFITAPLFTPGAAWDYSNTNYLLAGMIIAAETGMPAEQAMRTMMLQPQGLSHTWFFPQEPPSVTIPHFWFFNGTGVVDGMTFGYTPEGFYSSANTAGALFATAEDNVIFWNKLMSGGIINASSMAEWRQGVAIGGSTRYGLGAFRLASFNGRVIYQHGGTGAGAINENIADSLSGVCISVLTNQDSATNNMLLNGVVRALHRVTMNPPTAVYAVASGPQFALYPNPVRDELRIRWNVAPGADLHYVITNIAGKSMSAGHADTGSEMRIPVAGLPAGLYYLKVSGQDGMVIARPFTVAR
jgi:D-alanyl-D-alanine carboxypeptidase